MSKRSGWSRIGAVVAVGVLVASACRQDNDGATEEPDDAAGGAAATGDFGDLQDVCGPGDAKGATARGVTDTEIHVSTMGDPGNQAIPGLGQEYFDTAEAFMTWCNDAGGILGRELVVEMRDSALTEVGSKMREACQSDFFVVGNGNPLDAPGVEPRVGCDLGMFPVYNLSPQAAQAPLQAQVNGLPLDRQPVGLMRRLAEKQPEAWQHVAVLGSSVADIRPYFGRIVDGILATGGDVVVYEELPPVVDNYRPYVQRWKDAGVQALWGNIELAPLMQAAADVGFEVTFLANDESSYTAKNAEFAREGGLDLPPLYVFTNHFPVEMADEDASGATQQAIDMLQAVKPDITVGYQHQMAMSAWLSFAVAARDCGSDLTSECVLSKAEGDWTGGGMHPVHHVLSDPAELDASSSTCFLAIELTPDGWRYDEQLTSPNDETGYFNCDEGNVAQVDSHLGG